MSWHLVQSALTSATRAERKEPEHLLSDHCLNSFIVIREQGKL